MLKRILKTVVNTVFFVAVLCHSAHAVPVPVPPVVGTPGIHGDQLFFFFDARTGRVPFLTVSNLSLDDIDLEIVFYSQDLAQKLATRKEKLVGLGNVVLDPTTIPGVSGHAGLTVVTPVSGNPARPVVPPSAGIDDPTPPLFGSFTLANTDLGAGFGQNPLARVATNRRGERPASGLPVDGTNVRYQRIAPEALVVPSYFRPDTLSPTSKDGNRIVLVTFEDLYFSDGFEVRAKAIDFDAFFNDASGTDVATKTNVRVNGVHLDTLQNLAGATTLTSSGKITIATRNPVPDDTNLFGLVSQALGTFSVGQRMPGIFLSDREPAKIVFAARAVPNASFGGIKGADSICQQDAKAAGLPGTYLAWISDSKESPSTRFRKSKVPYILPTGARVADDWDDLMRGIDRAIDVAADGGTFPDRYVYTNTNIHGQAEETDPAKICDDWTSATNSNQVGAGDARAADVTWAFSRLVHCGPSFPVYGLYCFEQ